MHERSDVKVLQPLPYMPLVKPLPPWAYERKRKSMGLEVEQVPMFYVPGVLKSLDSSWLARAVIPPIRRLQKTAPLDLVDAHFGYPEGVGCAQAGRRLGLPVFITVRGFENEYVHKRIIGPRLVEELRAATGCICVSHSLEELLIRHGVKPERIRVVHNAIDWKVFNYGDREAARARLGVDVSRPLVVSVGHLIARKRHHVLIEAFARVRQQHPEARLAIIGGKLFEPRYPDELRAQVQALGLAEAVQFAGNLPPGDVVDWLRAADVFALATAREGCCNAVLEALAAGAPVVTTAVGDNPRFVREGENGHIVPVDDAPALADALGRALVRPAWDRPGISVHLRRQVGDWGAVADRVLDFFRERLERTGRSDLRGGER